MTRNNGAFVNLDFFIILDVFRVRANICDGKYIYNNFFL